MSPPTVARTRSRSDMTGRQRELGLALAGISAAIGADSADPAESQAGADAPTLPTPQPHMARLRARAPASSSGHAGELGLTQLPPLDADGGHVTNVLAETASASSGGGGGSVVGGSGGGDGGGGGGSGGPAGDTALAAAVPAAEPIGPADIALALASSPGRVTQTRMRHERTSSRRSSRTRERGRRHPSSSNASTSLARSPLSRHQSMGTNEDGRSSRGSPPQGGGAMMARVRSGSTQAPRGEGHETFTVGNVTPWPTSRSIAIPFMILDVPVPCDALVTEVALRLSNSSDKPMLGTGDWEVRACVGMCARSELITPPPALLLCDAGALVQRGHALS